MIYKIQHQSYTWLLLITLFFTIIKAFPQQLSTSKYGMKVLDNLSLYKESVRKEPAKNMVELKKVIPGIVYELRYAGTNNFLGRAMYPKNTNRTFLRSPAAEALAMVQKELNKKNLGLKIYDGYRPYSVTVTFWELIKDERYVADPSKGSGHNRGLAADLTIIDLSTGKELDMGTGFDNFSDTAHHTFTSLPNLALNNRKLLKDTMLKNGFQLFETEWWHYSWPNDKNYEVMDIRFRQLLKNKSEKR